MKKVLGSWFFERGVPRPTSYVLRPTFHIPRPTPHIPRALLVISVFQFFSFSAFSQLERTWQFQNPADYEVSDPQLIRANPASGGRAELVLQESLQDQSTISNYLAGTVSPGLRLGAESLLELQQDAQNLYVAPGVFRSRILDKGFQTASWNTLFSRVSNVLLANSPSGWTGTEQGLLRLYRFDNNVLDTISGDALSPVGGNVTFETEAQVGSHAVSFRGGKTPSLSLPRSQLNLTGSSAFTISFWVYPKDPPTFSDFTPYVNYAGGIGRFYFGYWSRTDDKMMLYLRDGSGGENNFFRVPLLPLNSWALVTIAWNVAEKYVNLYYNKDLVYSSLVSSVGTLTQTGDFTIGRDNSGSRVNARMDDLTIWDRLLTQDQISDYIDGLRAVQLR